MKDLRPSTTSSSPSTTIVVVIARRSEPTSGSVSASALIASIEATFGSQCALSSSEPPAESE